MRFETVPKDHLKLSEKILISLIFPLSWNGLNDYITNINYLLLGMFGLGYFFKLRRSYLPKNSLLLISTILFSSIYCIFLGQHKLNQVNLIENKVFNSSRNIEQSLIYSPLSDLVPALKWIFAIITFNWIIQYVSRCRPKLLAPITRAWIFGVIINIGVQIFQKFNSVSLIKPFLASATSDIVRPPGLASHPNALAITVCMTLPLLSIQEIQLKSSLKHSAFIAILVSTIFSGSRAGLIVFSITCLILFIKVSAKNQYRFSIWSILGLVIASLVILGFLNFIMTHTRLNSANISSQVSNNERKLLLRFGYQVFAHFPIFGAGTSFLKVSHNLYLQLLSSIGLLGFIAFIYFSYSILKRKSFFNYSFKIPFIVFLIFGLFNNSLSDFYLYFPICFSFIEKINIGNQEMKNVVTKT